MPLKRVVPALALAAATAMPLAAEAATFSVGPRNNSCVPSVPARSQSTGFTEQTGGVSCRVDVVPNTPNAYGADLVATTFIDTGATGLSFGLSAEANATPQSNRVYLASSSFQQGLFQDEVTISSTAAGQAMLVFTGSHSVTGTSADSSGAVSFTFIVGGGPTQPSPERRFAVQENSTGNNTNLELDPILIDFGPGSTDFTFQYFYAGTAVGGARGASAIGNGTAMFDYTWQLMLPDGATALSAGGFDYTGSDVSAEVPLPAALWFGAGGFGLLLSRRRAQADR
ncbi:hypothetical protein [Parvularcula maris]|uniref:VPLPA-CTERM sorting domain-containing protein n=1 Tax=Parvularcula maris TaxID=2965077 RepID=A0A9X2L6H3_9PROT|nr:hypothetical protein [Parvularcula maris]MCQ8183868.1 hypothetical protein [Parvularcula maris]